MELYISEYIRTKQGDIAQILSIDSSHIHTDEGLFNKEDIVNHNLELTYLAEEGDYINGARVYKNGGYDSLCVNGHSVHSTNILQFITKQKFYENCYSPKAPKFMQVIWKQIPEFPLYAVSNTGLVKILKTGKYMAYLQDRETLSVRLECPDGRRLRKSIAVLVLETFKEDAKGRLPKFIDGNNQNCTLDNLEWETREEQAKRVLPKRNVSSKTYKYHNIVGYHNGIPIVYAEHSGAMVQFLKIHCDNTINLHGNHFTRSIREGTPYKGMLFKCIQGPEYYEITRKVDLDKFDDYYRNNLHDKNQATITKEARRVVKKVVPEQHKPPIKHQSKQPVKQIKSTLDDLTDQDFIKDIEQDRRDKFKEELMRRLKNGRQL